MHRIGYHFPSITVEKACESLGVSLTNSGRVLQSTFALLDDVPACNGLGRNTQGQKKKKAGAFQSPAKFDISLSQAVIDTQAREAIKDLFPKIPAEDLHVIIGRSFQKVLSDCQLSLIY